MTFVISIFPRICRLMSKYNIWIAVTIAVKIISLSDRYYERSIVKNYARNY